MEAEKWKKLVSSNLSKNWWKNKKLLHFRKLENVQSYIQIVAIMFSYKPCISCMTQICSVINNYIIWHDIFCKERQSSQNIGTVFDDNSKIHNFPIFNLEVDIAQQGIRMISGPGLPVLFYSSHSCLVARLRVYHCGAELTSPSL